MRTLLRSWQQRLVPDRTELCSAAKFSPQVFADDEDIALVDWDSGIHVDDQRLVRGGPRVQYATIRLRDRYCICIGSSSFRASIMLEQTPVPIQDDQKEKKKQKRVNRSFVL